MTTANINPTAGSDGVPYSTAVPLTSAEADLNGGTNVPTGPIATEFGAAIVAVVTLTINGIVTANNSYIVMQQDLGDGVWVDMNWAVWTGSQGSATFVFSNGVAGADTFQQTRLPGAPPASSGSNQLTLGGRIRFVGKSNFAGGSSSLSGVTTAVLATIKYKLLGLR